MKKNQEEKTMYHIVKKLGAKIFSSSEKKGNSESKNQLSDQEIKLLDSFHTNSPTVALIYNHQNVAYDYFSPNIRHVMGYDDHDFMKGGFKFAMSLVLPAHTKVFNRYVLPVIFKYYTLYAFKNRVKDLKISFSFKIRRKDETYVWMLHHMVAMNTNKLGFPNKTLTTITDITEMKDNEAIDFSVFVKKENGYFYPIYSRTYNSSGDTFTFSSRELEILYKLAEGKTSKQIAHELKISPHTVITHRKKILEKSKAKNSAELIKFSLSKGLLNDSVLLHKTSAEDYND